MTTVGQVEIDPFCRAYQAHRRHGEQPCGPCTEGQRRYQEGLRGRAS